MKKITRRATLKLAAGFVLAGGIAMTGLSALAFEGVDYTPAQLKALQESGTPFLIDFYTDWCVTCAAQERVLGELQAESAAYKSIPILKVDWDVHSRSDLAKGLAIPRRSTLVVMDGERELGRVVAQTSKSAIAALLDKAL